MEKLKKSIVRVWSSTDKIAGAGFLVDDCHIVTCAHVIAMACSDAVDGKQKVESGITVRVDFPFLAAPSPQLTARVRVVESRGAEALDFAGLVLEEPAPAGTTPIRLIVADKSWGSRFRVFGFPVGRDRGEWATGHLREDVEGDWLQIDAQNSYGARVRPGYSGSPLWDESLNGPVGMVVAADRGDRERIAYVIPASILISAWSEVLSSRAIPPSPYRGLYSFEEGHARNFHGRESFVVDVTERTRTHPLTAIAAPSGMGKSSVVAAGIIPRIREEGGWLIVQMRPGREPFANLSFAIVRAMQHAPDAGSWTKTPTEILAMVRKQSFVDFSSELLRQSGCRQLLLVVDQFEELITLERDLVRRDEFIELLIEISRRSGEPERRATALVAIRSDYVAALSSQSKALGVLLAHNTVNLHPMLTSDLRRSIELPAIDLSVAFEEGLVDRIIDDFQSQPAALPVLQFLLNQLWEGQVDGMLSNAVYLELGQVSGSLSRYADDVYERLAEDEQPAARRVLLQLVGLADGSPETRRPLLEREVRTGDWSIVQRLTEDRLVYVDKNERGEDVAELVHESLAWNWPRLHEWIVDADERLRESDKKADMLTRRFAIGAGMVNLMPFPADTIAVGLVFARMGQKIAKAYDVRFDRQILRTAGITMAEGVLAAVGASWGGTSLLKMIPGLSVWVGLLIQPPLVAAIAYSVAATWKYYFHVVSAGGRGPDGAELREFVSITLRNRILRAGPSKSSVDERSDASFLRGRRDAGDEGAEMPTAATDEESKGGQH